MEHAFEQKVFYSDTDAYGVVWHGSYLRWLEMGRIELCEKAGYSLTKLYDANITLPVVDLNVRYKSPAKLEEEVLITTELKETSRISMSLLQRVYNAKDMKLHVEALVKVVATTNDGKIYRDLPQDLVDFIIKLRINDD